MSLVRLRIKHLLKNKIQKNNILFYITNVVLEISCLLFMVKLMYCLVRLSRVKLYQMALIRHEKIIQGYLVLVKSATLRKSQTLLCSINMRERGAVEVCGLD